MREVAVILYNNEIISITTGTAIHVEFDFEKAWEMRSEPDYTPSKLHFFHSHVVPFFSASDTDSNCLKGLNAAFGYTVLFSIIFLITGEMKTYQYIDNKLVIVPWYQEDEYLIDDIKRIMEEKGKASGRPNRALACG